MQLIAQQTASFFFFLNVSSTFDGCAGCAQTQLHHIFLLSLFFLSIFTLLNGNNDQSMEWKNREEEKINSLIEYFTKFHDEFITRWLAAMMKCKVHFFQEQNWNIMGAIKAFWIKNNN
jgi:hypothetical protein